MPSRSNLGAQPQSARALVSSMLEAQLSTTPAGTGIRVETELHVRHSPLHRVGHFLDRRV